ncbi:hypothetical protein EYF80_003616 [Liparis tanakae]|uniref:Uncharacterized protein n=1 Tax=Liparis tanakae TaxID=230148 RepID=A0A4Z2J7N8_9TELE|nr:hypothetical protein EYF80_003616 [Liparis tanakae]
MDANHHTVGAVERGAGAVAHPLGQLVALQDALLQVDDVWVLALDAAEGPELAQRQLHILRRVAADLLHRHPGPRALHRRLIDHAVTATPHLLDQLVLRLAAYHPSPRCGRRTRGPTGSVTETNGCVSGGTRRQLPMSSPLPPHTLCSRQSNSVKHWTTWERAAAERAPCVLSVQRRGGQSEATSGCHQAVLLLRSICSPTSN